MATTTVLRRVRAKRGALISLTFILAGSMLLSSCGAGSVKVATGAARQGGTALGHSPVTIEASADDVARLASRAQVKDDVIRQVAPKLDQQPTWQKSLSGARTIYDEVPDDVKEVLVGVACDGVNGEIDSVESLQVSIASKVVASPDQISALVDSVRGLWDDLYQASMSGDPEVRASALLTCFTIEQIMTVG